MPILGLFLSLFILLYNLLSILATYELNAYIGILSLIDIGLLVFVVIALVLIFSKKKIVPKVMIAFYITNIVIQAVLSFLVSEYSGIIQTVIAGAIWIPYFLKSERVKNTFIK